MQQYLLYNNTIQTILQAAPNQSLTSQQLLSISQTQQYASYSALLALEASSKTQTALTLSQLYVSTQQALFSDMIAATNNSQNLVAQSLYLRILTNRTIEAVTSEKTIELTETDVFDIQKKLLNLTVLISTQIQASKTFLTSYQTILNHTNIILSIILNTTNVLYPSISQANIAKQAAVQVNIAQSISLQASIKAARLALCYPNPCLHGGMCTANNDNVSYTCFCSFS